ncbi:MAG: hypothetical protein C4555_00005, partial [Dehalococcoidia bacterium]
LSPELSKSQTRLMASHFHPASKLAGIQWDFFIKWFGQASVTIARDDELLELAAASGCIGLLIGFESISPANLEIVGKKINNVDEYQDVIRKIHSRGIGIHGFFITGLDEDKEESALSTLPKK